MSTPSISIVTPSFGQSRFLEATLRSVLEGSVVPDEYMVADGGSTDGSVEILERWSPRLTAWWSERDGGQYDAVNRALGQTTGDVMGWLNSDDLYMPWTLAVVQDIFRAFPEVEWLTTLYPLTVDDAGRVVMCAYTGGFDRASFMAGANLPHSQGYWRGVQQESTFWRRSLWEKAGGYVDGSLRAAGDFELWSRFVEHADLVGIESPLGAFRSHGDQKTVHLARTYHHEGLRVLEQHGWHRSPIRATRLRSALSKAVGRRSLKRLPPRLSGALVRGGVLRKTRVVTWAENGWKLFDDYVA
jgi:glycosyltransferase involved in cell wall biosynthesis